MKILQINLLAFGPFTDTVIDLKQGHEGLHIIYGPNEAGKSTALRALRQMLYGIPERCADDFRHPYARLRIGAILRKSDGTILEFLRRKGRTNTLRSSDDETLVDESLLQAFLGGADADLFTAMFGIDHSDLVRGGREIIQGNGNIGQILFAAGSGISDLHKVQQEFISEADALFRPSGQKQKINEAVARLKKTQKMLREAELPGQEWTRHDSALRQALEIKLTLDRDLEKIQRRKNHLERVKEALPLISRRQELARDLDTCADAVLLPDGFSERRREAMTRLHLSTHARAQALQYLEEIKHSLQALKVPDTLLDRADPIEAIYQELGSHRKALKDRAELLIRQHMLEKEAAEILKNFRSDLSLAQIDQIRVGKAESIRIQELGNALERLQTRLQGAEEEAAKLSYKIKRLKAQRAETESPLDCDALGHAVERAREQGLLEENYRKACQEIRKAEEIAANELKKQTLWTGSLDSLETLSLPALDTIDMFEHRLAEAENTETRLRADLDETLQSLVEIDGRIEQLKLEREVPTESDLHDARQTREIGWQKVRRAWLEIGPVTAAEQLFEAEFTSINSLAEAYEHSVRYADEIADRLRREAERVAAQANLLADRQTGKNRCRLIEENLQRSEKKLTEIKLEWIAVWQVIGVTPRSPREMRAWTQKQMALVGQIRAIRDLKALSDDFKTRIEKHQTDIRRCLALLGQPPAVGHETLAQLIESGRQIVARMQKRQAEEEQLMRAVAQAETDLQEVTVRAEQVARELSRHRIQWKEAVRPLGLEQNATPAQANAVLEDLKTLFAKLKEGDVLRRRIQGIDRDAQTFNQRVNQLVEGEAPELAALPVEQAATELYTWLNRGRSAQAERLRLQKQADRQKEQLHLAQTELIEVQARLAGMCQEAACENEAELPAAEERSALKQQIGKELAQLEAHLRQLSAGATLEEFTARSLSIDPDGIDPELTRLNEAVQRLTRQKSELDQTIGSERTELARMDGSPRAAELAEEAQAILGQLDTDVQHYARLKLSSAVLDKAIERYREKNQGPILRRSNELFAQMTLGAFEGLRVEFNDKAQTVLVGVRPGSRELVAVDGMSEGTADQLYLAVRMASVEAYLLRNEPLPFIVDDILIKFDDHRAAATLRCLARLSQQTQVVFFTHHQHLLDLARGHVAENQLFVHALSNGDFQTASN